MIIKCAKSNQKAMPASQQVNRIGKYMYKNLDGSLKMETSSNMCDVYFLMLYQIPFLQRVPGKGPSQNKLHEITINLNITTYQNKVRVNVIEVTPQERTLGFDLYDPDELEDLEKAKNKILQRVVKRVKRAYSEYEVLF